MRYRDAGFIGDMTWHFADHDPACDRRSAYDLREQLNQHDQTQLTGLLSPLTVLTPAPGP